MAGERVPLVVPSSSNVSALIAEALQMDGANLGRFRPCGGSADDVALAVRSAMDDLAPANHAPAPCVL